MHIEKFRLFYNKTIIVTFEIPVTTTEVKMDSWILI